MEREERIFLDAGTLGRLEQCADYFTQKQQSVYIVGGAVRNLLLHEPSTDWDFAVRGNVPLIARQLADHLHGFSAHMHDKASRVVVKEQDKELIFDLAPLHGSGIEDDLRERDFTINAMALPLSTLLKHLQTGEELTVIDPLHGQEDLEARMLRAVQTDVFRHDPLRMLRAVRLLIHYQLSLEKQTKSWIQRDAPLLLQAAAERIHEEFYTILKAPGGTEHLYFLDQLGLLGVLFPELIAARDMPQPELHHWDVFKHSLEAVSMLELLTDILQGQTAETTPEFARLAENTPGDLQELHRLLREAEQQGIFHFAQMHSTAMKLGALLHDIGKPPTYTRDESDAIRFYGHPQTGVPIAREIMRRLGTSTQDRRLVQQIVAHHMRPGQLSHDVVSERAIRRYFVELGPVGLYVGLTSLADHLAMRGPEPLTEAWRRHLSTVRILFTRYIQEREVLLPPRLLQGEELIRRLHLTPGPLIGQLLEIIAEAQTEGQVSSKDEALWLAEEYLAQKGSGQEREGK